MPQYIVLIDTGRRKRHTNLKDSQELETIQSVPEHSGRRKRNSERALIFVDISEISKWTQIVQCPSVNKPANICTPSFS